MRTDGFGASRLSSTSGVLPTRERRLSATTGALDTAGHGGEQDHGRAVLNAGVEAVERAHVFALHVDVHERRKLFVFDELRTQAGKAQHQVVEELADGLARRGNLALAAGLGTQR